MADVRANGIATDAHSSNGTGGPFRRARRVTVRQPPAGAAVTASMKPYAPPIGTIMPPPDYDLEWNSQQLDTDAQARMPVGKLLEFLMNLSPEMSKGAWDYMRLLNPGWTVEARNVGRQTINRRAQILIEAFLDRLKQTHGSVDVVLGRLHMGAYMRGGYFGEIVFDEQGREAIDIATPDPATVRFKIVDGGHGQKRWQLGQWQDGAFVALDEQPSVAYLPVDPFPGNPYGRPLIAPAIFAALFLIGLLHDLRRVISQQGWPRIDISLNVTKILEGLEREGESLTQEDVEQSLSAAISEVQAAYARLQPDDAYIHGDEVEIKGPIGVTGTANLGGIDAIIEVDERMLVRALKTMPLMLGITDGVSEANANRQWEILVTGVKALQHLAESMLERFLELACQAQGIQADVKFVFSEVRAAEAQRDALTFSQEIDNQFKLLDKGIIDRDEAADTLVNHPPAKDEDEMAALAVDATPASPDAPVVDVQDPDQETEPSGNTSAYGWDRPLGRLVPYDHPLRPPRIATPASYRAEMRILGWSYAGAVYVAPDASGDALPRVTSGYDEECRARAGTIVRGECDVAAVYDVFVKGERHGRSRTVPAPAGRHPVGAPPAGGRRRAVRR
jgi:hypothetical protein